jgi:hypothetical protein
MLAQQVKKIRSVQDIMLCHFEQSEKSRLLGRIAV